MSCSLVITCWEMIDLLEYSAILLTFIKLPFVVKIFVLSIFEWPFYTDFTVCSNRGKVTTIKVKLQITPYLNKNSKGNVFILKKHLYAVSNFRPFGLCQETNISQNKSRYLFLDKGQEKLVGFDTQHKSRYLIFFLTKAKRPKILNRVKIVF